MTRRRSLSERAPFLAALPMLAVLAIPLIALAGASSPDDIAAGARHALFAPALWLSIRTTLVGLGMIAVAGTPLAWWMARSGRGSRMVELLVDLPIVVPPAVMGIALLEAFGRNGLFGPVLSFLGLQIPFTTAAVVAAQVVVSAPFYIQASASAFRRVDEDLLIVARTLGHSPASAFFRIAVPLALPGMVAGAALAWARALGEFGATLLFAGNFAGSTQTMPLAIYTALESDAQVAVALALVLVAASALLLIPLRAVPALIVRRFGAERGAEAGAGRPPLQGFAGS